MAKVKSWTGVWITEPKVLGVFPRGDNHPHPPARTDRTIIPKEKKDNGNVQRVQKEV